MTIIISMITSVTMKNMVSIPTAIYRRFGIKPGWKLDRSDGAAPDRIVVRVIPDRAESGRRLAGAGKHLAPGVDSAAALAADRDKEG